jgi:hypothetical protein
MPAMPGSDQRKRLKIKRKTPNKHPTLALIAVFVPTNRQFTCGLTVGPSQTIKNRIKMAELVPKLDRKMN